jgi:hypothetical protein
MCRAWNTLKNTVEAGCTDLRAALKTMVVPVNLIDPVTTLEWIIRDEPKIHLSRNALIQTIRDCLDDLRNCSRYADDAEKTELRDRINGVIRSIDPALYGYAQWND